MLEMIHDVAKVIRDLKDLVLLEKIYCSSSVSFNDDTGKYVLTITFSGKNCFIKFLSSLFKDFGKDDYLFNSEILSDDIVTDLSFLILKFSEK